MNDDPEFAPTLADVLALFHRRAGNEYTRDMAGKVSFSFYFRIIWAIRLTDVVFCVQAFVDADQGELEGEGREDLHDEL